MRSFEGCKSPLRKPGRLQPPDDPDRKARPTLERIASDRGQPLETFENDIEAAMQIILGSAKSVGIEVKG